MRKPTHNGQNTANAGVCILGIASSEEPTYYRVVRYLVALLVAAGCSGATVVASAFCSDGVTVQTATSANCSGPLTSANAQLGGGSLLFEQFMTGFAVSAEAAYFGNGLDQNQADGMALLGGIYNLTVFGGTGIAVVQPCYVYRQASSTALGVGNVQAIIGLSSLLTQQGGQSGCANGIGPVQFGVTTPIHITLSAHAQASALPGGSGEAAVALRSLQIFDQFGASVSGASFTFTPADTLSPVPEPASRLLLLCGLVYGLYLRRSANPTTRAVRRSLDRVV